MYNIKCYIKLIKSFFEKERSFEFKLVLYILILSLDNGFFNVWKLSINFFLNTFGSVL